VADDAGLKTYRPCEYENVVTSIIEDKKPGIVLFGGTRQGRELSAGVAARLDAGLAVECTDFTLEDGRLVATRPMYGGKVIATVDIEGDIQMASIRPNVFEVEEASGAGNIESVAVELGEVNVTLMEEKIEISAKAELTEADYIVSGGRGMEGDDFLHLKRWPACWAVLWVRPEMLWTWAGVPSPTRWARPVKWSHPSFTLPAASPVPCSMWPVCPPQTLLSPSTTTRMP